MARYLLKAIRNLTTSEGPIKAGATLAILETELQPIDLAGWTLYEHAKAVESDEEMDLLTRKSVQDSRAAGEQPPEPEAVPETDDLELDEEEDEEPVKEEDEESPEHWSAQLEGLDSRTVDALDDAGITSIDELKAKMNADEKIRGIGDLREQEIMEAFEKLDAK